MTPDIDERAKLLRSLNWLSFANVAIWAIAIIAMVFLMQDSAVVKKLFPILAGRYHHDPRYHAFCFDSFTERHRHC